MAMAKTNPELAKVLESFMKVMGDHFTSLGNKEKKKKEEQVAKHLVAAGYTECTSLGDAAPPEGSFVREKHLDFRCLQSL